MELPPKTSLLRSRYGISTLEIACIVGLALVPLLVGLPYRVNIFLTWEGAYRLYLGEMPYRDFGIPTGFAFWVIPAIFFKIFGPYLVTLVKAQVLINIISGLSFRSILRSLKISPGIRLLSIVVFCLSYSFFNFWPWYNQSVIVFELVALSLLMKYLLRPGLRGKIWHLLGSAAFVFISFFTKQDAGGMTLLICLFLLAYCCNRRRDYRPLLWFLMFFAAVAAAVILPFSRYGFGYWFNYGQAPHNSRLSGYDLIDEFLTTSDWLKFYLLAILMLFLARGQNLKKYFQDQPRMVFTLLTLGILTEAAIFQVTSYTPPDNNIFFHSFAFVFILTLLNEFLNLDFTKWKILLPVLGLVVIWWSGTYWKYLDRILVRDFPSFAAPDENEISIRTYMLNRDTVNSDSKWVYSDIPAFRKIYMPASTAKGMDRILQLPVVKNSPHIRVLNMTELTPLAWAMPYRPETGQDIPLWYHKGVAMFQRQIDQYIQRIDQKQYDLVLYEYVPELNNFFPFEIRNALEQHYRQVDHFLAPRRGSAATIEVYLK
ncbi:MAG TPA: hypothetical protein VMV20_04275 [Chitinophagaceae bacterium]|nr:hypothetical protein [Chitinophagaceae bacterium]